MYETNATAGISSLMAALLTKDTQNLSASQVAASIENLGGSLRSNGGNNSFSLSMEVLSDDLASGLSLFSDALLRPTFTASTFARERAAQVAAIQADEDDMIGFATRKLRALFFGKFPYAHDEMGNIGALESLCPDDVKTHYERLVCARNSVIAVAGDFNRQAILDQLGPTIEVLPKTVFTPENQIWTGSENAGTHTFFTLPREQTVVMYGFPAPNITDDFFYTNEVLESILSGFSSRLFMTIREEHNLAYFVSAARIAGLSGSLMYLYAGTHAEHEDQVWTLMQAEIDRLRAGKLEADELIRAQTHLKAHKRMSLQRIGSRASQAALNALYGLPISLWQDFDNKIDAVTLDELTDFAQQYLDESKSLKLSVRSK
jgi:zinc protease